MKQIKIAFLNIRSLIPHLSDFTDVVKHNDYDIVGLSETWLNSNIGDEVIYLQGYKVVRSDRHCRGGGVALYIKDSIPFSVCHSSVGSVLEEIWVELNFLKKNFYNWCYIQTPQGWYGGFFKRI